MLSRKVLQMAAWQPAVLAITGKQHAQQSSGCFQGVQRHPASRQASEHMLLCEALHIPLTDWTPLSSTAHAAPHLAKSLYTRKRPFRMVSVAGVPSDGRLRASRSPEGAGWSGLHSSQHADNHSNMLMQNLSLR